MFKFAPNRALGTKMAPPRVHHTCRLEFLNKTQVSDPGSLGPLLACVNT